ncbi:MAG: hydrogenase iron-sulfur subunit [Candidatus Thorarchaeota archaeon]|nr:hydrogenase iron-sulfur subunit [Candidatus Thorarchaeota archaeon]
MSTTSPTSKADGKAKTKEQSKKKTFEPRILAMCCNWCSYAGADLAGTSRMTMPPNLRVIRVNCTGRIDPLFILQALEAGADAVLISGCHEGDCHYVTGNVFSKKRFMFFKKILEQFGLGDRVDFVHVSAAEGNKWAAITTEFVERIKKLGPTPVKNVTDLTDISIDDDHSRKGRIHEIIVSLSNRLGYEPKKPLHFDPEEVVEGYGFPKRDPDKCIGCYACYNVCPEDAIKIEDVQNKRRYGTLHAQCLVCKECEKVCPQEAIEIAPGFELLSFLLNEPLWEFDIPMQKCSECGDYFNPKPFCEHLEKKISEKKAEEALEELNLPFKPYTTCSACKRKKLAQAVAEVAHPALKRMK